MFQAFDIVMQGIQRRLQIVLADIRRVCWHGSRSRSPVRPGDDLNSATNPLVCRSLCVPNQTVTIGIPPVKRFTGKIASGG